jgi:Poly(ADP-ribose) polymerase catalytic domain/Poly(ADP-ribose) polymerase, regulatory domain/WGR domain
MEIAKKLDDQIDPIFPPVFRDGSLPYVDPSDDSIYLAALNQSDLATNTNKYFILQLIVGRTGMYFLFTKSGRVGVNGTVSTDAYMNRDEAVADFKAVFREKTGIEWEDRDTVDPVDGKYTYVILNHKDVLTKSDSSASPSLTFDRAVSALFTHIFNKDIYTDLLNNMKMDTRRSPLGKISKLQVERATAILDEILKLIDIGEGERESERAREEIIDLSSKYYTMIPTAQGMSKLPPLDTVELIQQKKDLLKVLYDISDVAQILVNDQNVTEKYRSLHCSLVEETDIDNLTKINNALKGTFSPLHTFKVNLKHVIKVERHGESAIFQRKPNTCLLWHGTRTVNVASILTTGLKINPVGVTKTGSMFGNGIYFANCSSKSTQYTYATDVGMLFLCEVAVGTPKPVCKSTIFNEAPDGYNSVWGVGEYAPDPAGDVYIDGAKLATGRLKKVAQATALKHDEFIVYDSSQIRLKYIVLIDIGN